MQVLSRYLSNPRVQRRWQRWTIQARPLDIQQLYTLGANLLTRGPSLVIITLDAHGALLMTADSQVEVPASPVSPVDTTGAGDAFIGAILYQLVERNCSTPADL